MKKNILFGLILCSSSLFADVYATFEAKAVKEASLNLISNGTVEKIYVDVGSRVKKGQTLLSLKDGEERAAYMSAKSDYEFLSSQYARYQKSSEVFDKNTLERVRAETERAKNQTAMYGERLSKMHLSAPFSGLIAEKNIELGDTAGLGSKPLFRLISEDTKLIIQFDSRFADKVKVGDEFCYGFDGKPSGKCVKINKIYPAVNQNNKKLTAEAIANGVKAGIFGDGQIKTK
ncbi:MAG TPA: efflux RND transporter periplasmic adaptor subunit [Campylobacterales bacterium]|nr:efflux RND transporter periplasmic adaptor subunit [Campylobacterales bacterium]